MSTDKKMLTVAAEEAVKGMERDKIRRQFMLGAVGVRNDGVIVTSRNVASPDPAPNHHAETRLAKKLTPGSTVWVARVAKGTGGWAMSRPCPGCMRRLRAAGVERIVYTMGPNEWGVVKL